MVKIQHNVYVKKIIILNYGIKGRLQKDNTVSNISFSNSSIYGSSNYLYYVKTDRKIWMEKERGVGENCR